MGIGDIICEYIYGSFLLIKAAMEVAEKTARMTLKQLDALFNTLLSVCRYTVDTAIKTVLDAIRVFQKWLVDKLLNMDYKAICDGMFRCTELLEQLLDPTSLLTRTIKKYTNYKGKTQEEIFKVIRDFKEFQAQVCTFGVTFNFGLSAIKDLLSNYYAMIDEFLQMLERYKEKIRRFLQKYLDILIDIGVFDMLDKLKKFFDCVLIDTDICSNIRTANSFYKSMLRKMCIEESGNGYKLNSQVSAQYLNAFNSRINQLDNAKIELKKLIDSMLNPSQVKAAKNAFNISANIFPGGMTWTDIKKGRLSKNVCYKYFKLKRRAFINAIREDFKDDENIFYDTDSILDSMKINDENGTITINLNNINKTYSTYNLPADSYEYITDNPIEYILDDDGNAYDKNGALYDKTNDIIVSNLYGAIDITINGNNDLKTQCLNKFNFDNYTSEDQLTKTF